jgi:hypothetical protein
MDIDHQHLTHWTRTVRDFYAADARRTLPEGFSVTLDASFSFEHDDLVMNLQLKDDWSQECATRRILWSQVNDARMRRHLAELCDEIMARYHPCPSSLPS